MERNIFQVFSNAVKRKVKPILAKVSSFFRPSSVKSRATSAADRAITKSMNFKPKDEHDYYGIGRWLVSKRLAFFCVILVGVIGLYYFLVMSPVNFFDSSSDGIRVYSYKSIPLRFVSGIVKIKSKNGDIAYKGEVSKGMANGSGSLFYPDGTTMYEGGFKNNQYNGEGTEYYASGIAHFAGNFVNNQPDGQCASYRENGSKEYEGDFRNGLPDGTVSYYDSSSNIIYKGSYSQGLLLYTDLVGKGSDEIAKMYTGERIIFFNDTTYLVVLKDINAVYGGDADQNPLEDTISADSTYVYQNECYISGKACHNINELKNLLGEPVYEGNTYLNMSEVIALKNSPLTNETSAMNIWVETQSEVNDVYEIQDYYREQLAYIYTFNYEGIQYTFYCNDKNGDFMMYLLRKI